MQGAVTESWVRRVWAAGAVAVVSALLSLNVPGVARASCAEPITCICEEWPHAHVIHGRVADRAGDVTQVEVNEVLAGQGADLVATGDVITGILDEARACGFSLHSFAPGDEVLALWQGTAPDADQCPEYSDCEASNCSAFTDDAAALRRCRAQCVEEARASCPSLLAGLVLLPWGEKIDLGEGRTIAPDAASVLADRNQCNLEFAGPPPPCDDVKLIGVVDHRTCSAGLIGSTASEHSVSARAGLLGFALLCLVRRKRRVPR